MVDEVMQPDSIEFWKLVENMLEKSRLPLEATYFQHGNTSTLLHSLAVADRSLRVANKLPFKFSYTELVRGAILHDYYLYDWHVDTDTREGHHGFTHARAALQNANVDFTLSPKEKDIVVRHMFPLNIVPPCYKESWLVMICDKVCSTKEIFVKESYPELNCKLKSILLKTVNGTSSNK